MALFRCDICNELRPDWYRVKATRGIKISDSICRECAGPAMHVRAQFLGKAGARKSKEKREKEDMIARLQAENEKLRAALLKMVHAFIPTIGPLVGPNGMKEAAYEALLALGCPLDDAAHKFYQTPIEGNQEYE